MYSVQTFANLLAAWNECLNLFMSIRRSLYFEGKAFWGNRDKKT